MLHNVHSSSFITHARACMHTKSRQYHVLHLINVNQKKKWLYNFLCDKHFVAVLGFFLRPLPSIWQRCWHKQMGTTCLGRKTQQARPFVTSYEVHLKWLSPPVLFPSVTVHLRSEDGA